MKRNLLPQPFISGFRFAVILALLLGAAVARPAFAQVATAEPPLARQPYRVHVLFAPAEQPDLTPEFGERLARQIPQDCWRIFGEAWDLTLISAGLAPDPPAVPPELRAAYEPLLRLTSPAALAVLTPAALPIPRRTAEESRTQTAAVLPPPTGEAPDKLILLSLERVGNDYVIAAREWDRVTDSLGNLHRFSTPHRRLISETLLQAVTSVFRPVARVLDAEAATTTLEVQASAIATPDPTALAVTPGHMFQPVFHRSNREGVLVEIRGVPWTYLEVRPAAKDAGESEPDARATGSSSTGGALLVDLRLPVRVHTALRSTLSGRRGVVDAWAVGVDVARQKTMIEFLRRRDGVPLAGRVVEVSGQPPAEELENPQPIASLLTDRTGLVTVSAAGGPSLVWLTVKSGDAILQFLPLVPGSVDRLEVRLGDDPARLEAEGELAVLSGDLIEAVAKRATLLAKARVAARDDNFALADEMLKAAGDLTNVESYQRRITTIEAPAVKAAQEMGDRLTAARIVKRAASTRELVERYLSADAVRVVREEVDELRRATAGVKK